MNKLNDIYESLPEDGLYLVHFSNLEHKVGINPKSKFNTPIGIYGYIFNKTFINEYNKHLLKFASDRDYIHVLKIDNDANVFKIGHNISNNTEYTDSYSVIKLVDELFNIELNEKQRQALIDPNDIHYSDGMIYPNERLVMSYKQN
jgi:hypothetical protein